MRLHRQVGLENPSGRHRRPIAPWSAESWSSSRRGSQARLLGSTSRSAMTTLGVVIQVHPDAESMQHHLEVDEREGPRIRSRSRTSRSILPASRTTRRRSGSPRERGIAFTSTRCTAAASPAPGHNVSRRNRHALARRRTTSQSQFDADAARRIRSSTKSTLLGSRRSPGSRAKPSLGKEGCAAILAFVVLGVEVAEQAARRTAGRASAPEPSDHADDAGSEAATEHA